MSWGCSKVVAMADSGATPDVVAQQIRYALNNLAVRNGHHLFEEICRHFAAARISSNILPATGPVSAGGDQGRDFETFRSFVAVEEAQRLVFACTLEQIKRLPDKVKADVATILSGPPVDAVYLFCEANVPKGKREKLISWAWTEHEVELVVFDGNALAERLTTADVYWIAERYLSLPSQTVLAGLGAQQKPANLPSPARKLFGRDDALTIGARYLSSEAEARSLLVVTGAPGVGKTVLAQELARSVETYYPDGQYLLDVPVGGDSSDETGLLELLSAQLDEDVNRPEETARQRLARLRSFFADRKSLVVVDNVQSEQQLQDLVAIGGGLVIVCTSRSRLTGLAVDDAEFIEVQPLSGDAAAELASTKADRLTQDEARTLAQVCGGLPLAILIAAAQIKTRPHLRVPDYLQQLADPDHGLKRLSAGARSMETIVEDSYCSLTDEQSKLIRILGLLPNTTVTLDIIAAASADDVNDLSDDTAEQASRLLDELFELNLVDQRGTDRYRLHDVLYRFARRKATAKSLVWREQVLGNACLMYAARALRAVSSIGFVDEEASVPSDANASAIQMLEEDRAGAVAIVESDFHAELWDNALKLTEWLIPALRHRGHWNDLQRACQGVLSAGEQTGNEQWAASALHNLGMAAGHLGNSDEAINLFKRCSELAHRTGEHHLGYLSYASYGNLLLDLGHIQDGTVVLRQTLKIWRIVEDDVMLAQTLGNLGVAHLANGDLIRAETYLRNSIAVSRRAKSAGLLPTLSTKLSTVLRMMGRSEEAHKECQDALSRARAVGDRGAEAEALLEYAFFVAPGVSEEDPAHGLETALSIFREIGDMKGQVNAFRLLGGRAKLDGHLEQADKWLCECANLAAQIGDAHHHALATAHLAKMRGEIGRHAEASQLFGEAQEIADITGNDFLASEVSDQQATLLRRIGHTEQAIQHLRKSVRLQEKKGHSKNLALTRVVLGEALSHGNQWEEATHILRLVAEAPHGSVHPNAQAQAFRHLGVLYSKRDLRDEAEYACERALILAQEGNSLVEQMHCNATFGNVLARAGRWQEAVAKYELAAPVASRLHDHQVLLNIHSNRATYSFKLGNRDKAITQTRQGIEVATSLGLTEGEASLRVNLGSALADSGDINGAIDEFITARDAAATLGNTSLAAQASMNLAKAHAYQANPEAATDAARYARRRFQKHGDWRAAAGALLMELKSVHTGSDPAGLYQALEGLRATPPGVPPEVLSALWARGTDDPDDTPAAEPVSPTGRRIHIANEVRRQLDGIDIDDYCASQANTRRHCYVCKLPIAPTGQAELLYIQFPGGPQDAITLAHTACAPSSIIALQNRPPEADAGGVEIECAMLEGDMPGIVVDCRGGTGIGENGKLVDPFLEMLKMLGFVSVGKMATSDELNRAGTELPQLAANELSAHLVQDRLTILAGRKPILSGAPLSFLPRWHRAAQQGTLVALFGRNLQGMTWENLQYVFEAARTGNLVGAVLHLDATPPGRNSTCVCTPRTGLKYKRCCGRPNSGDQA